MTETVFVCEQNNSNEPILMEFSGNVGHGQRTSSFVALQLFNELSSYFSHNKGFSLAYSIEVNVLFIVPLQGFYMV